jgi:threonine/homoserine/homoserine lactone efflux protein
MFDARYFAFASVSALLVISPGAAMAVVMEASIAAGRTAALFTVVGINLANASLALGSALGMSVVFHQWPWSLQAVRVTGAAYLGYLGLRALWLAAGGTRGPLRSEAAHMDSDPGMSRRGRVLRGLTTNLLNPSVVLFYMMLLPQFVGPNDAFVPRFLVLATTHICMSLLWLSLWAITLGALAGLLARPVVKRSLEALTGVVLLGLAARLALS